MSKKLRVAIVFGGKSAEHEVSLQSAKSIVDAIDKEKYEIVLIGIDKQGRWLLHNESAYLLNSNNPKLIRLNRSHKNITLSPGDQKSIVVNEPNNLTIQQRSRVSTGTRFNNGKDLGQIDVVFPVLHGTYGEDGSMQGLLRTLDLPFVGAGVLGSAVGMDKDVMKRLLRDAGIPVAKFITLTKNVILSDSEGTYRLVHPEGSKRFGEKDSSPAKRDQNDNIGDFSNIVNQLGIPFFLKPANSGSSVGVHKVHNEKEFQPAIKDAFQYDTKILVEEYIKGREIECSVLGNENPIASIPGEIIPQHEFYSYEAKYIDEQGALLKIPADLPKKVIQQVQLTAIKAFKVLSCEGMARVDCFLTADNKLYLNEINTIPGFTKISMYPKLWEASGIAYSDLIDRLIELAIARHQRDKKLKTTFV